IGFTVWNLAYIPSAFIGWDMLKSTGGWTIPLAAVMYVSVSAYVAWHLRDMEGDKRPRSSRPRTASMYGKPRRKPRRTPHGKPQVRRQGSWVREQGS
ncbi:MAG: hypothetical protein KAT70_06580, partial [Thermoplasmata archaeon]|nr:hypothetical protein [Thermoplasmata archaeon]